MSKIRVFLAGYINYTNAQNLNCRSIAEHLNRENFEVYTLRVHFGDNKKYHTNSFMCYKPFSITKYFGFLWGIIKCDVAYFSKHIDTPIWVLIFAKLLGKPLFSTIEGNVSDLSKPNLIKLFRSKRRMQYYFSYFNAVFGITRYLIANTSNVVKMQEYPLYLGVESANYSNYKKESLSSIIFVGSLIKRKRVDEFITLSTLYPDIEFKIVGEGPEIINLQDNAPSNVKFFGGVSQNVLDDLFSSSELLYLPSRSEGFPKVILEAAAAGIPSLVYDTYGASDWIEHRKDGFIASSFSDVEAIVDEILNNPELLQKASKNTQDLANRFDWKNIIDSWEHVIQNLYNGE